MRCFRWNICPNLLAVRRIGFTLSLALLGLCIAPASAHFVFVVPEPGAAKAKIVMSETLEPDEDVDLIKPTQLALRDAAGKDAKIELGATSEDAISIDLPGNGQRVAHGVLELGVQKRGEGKAFLLVYHPKTIIGDAFDAKSALGESAKAEIIATGKPGQLVFQVFLKGKPLANAKTMIVFPDGKEKEFATDADGKTSPVTESGRYGVWARCVEPVAGEHAGKAYEEIRHYPTLVVDISETKTAAASEPAPVSEAQLAAVSKEKYPKLPEAVSSFGAAATEGWLYVYGGHTAPTHHYDTKAVSGKFHRLKLDGGTSWEPLADGLPLQGMNLATHAGKVYRVGGMHPLNEPGKPVDTHSTADVARFDAAANKWESILALSEPRSSHDVVVLDNKLYVLGGWNMKGKAGNTWPDATEVLDLNNPSAQWTKIKQPFQRRALIAAVFNGKIYAIGGFDENDDPSLKVEILDPATGIWTSGPNLIGRERNGFAPAACVLDGNLYVSVMDGSLLRLNDVGTAWDIVAKTTPRIVHRLVPHAGQILVIGGADRGGNFDLIETVTPVAAVRSATAN